MYKDKDLLDDIEKMLEQRKAAGKKTQQELDGCIMAIQEYFIKKADEKQSTNK
jgi:hypothetical protein